MSKEIFYTECFELQSWFINFVSMEENKVLVQGNDVTEQVTQIREALVGINYSLAKSILVKMVEEIGKTALVTPIKEG